MKAVSSSSSLELSFWQRRAWLLVAAIVLFTAVGVVIEYRREVSDWTTRSEELAARASEMLRGVEGTVTATAAAVALVDADGSVDPRQFRLYAETLLANAGVLSVAREELISSAERQDFEAELGRSIFSVTEDGESVEVSDSPEHLVIVDVWPESFREIIGRDLLADPSRREAALLARDTGSVTITRPVPMGTSQRTGVLLMVPLYPLGAATDDVDQRREALTGMITVGHFADVFLSNVVSQLPIGTSLRIEDGVLSLAETPSSPGQRAGSATVDVGNRNWTVTVVHPRGIDYSGVLGITGTGILLAVLVGLASWQSLVQSRKLSAAHDELAALVFNMQRDLLQTRFDLREVGMSAVARYVPAAEHANLGGDWYDIFQDKNGHVVLTMGDVTGHGVDAVLQMHQIRQAVTAYAFDGRSPALSITLANQLLRDVRPGGLIASVWLGTIDPETGILSFTSAGHPPALLNQAGSETVELEGNPGPLLNIGIEQPSWNDFQIQVHPDDLLTVYTDGIIEARGLSLNQGIALAKSAVGDPTRNLDDIADDILAARPDPGRDDAALLLVRMAPDTSIPADQTALPEDAHTSEGIS